MLESDGSDNKHRAWKHAGISSTFAISVNGFSCPRLQLPAIVKLRPWRENCCCALGKPSHIPVSKSLAQQELVAPLYQYKSVS